MAITMVSFFSRKARNVPAIPGAFIHEYISCQSKKLLPQCLLMISGNMQEKWCVSKMLKNYSIPKEST